MLSRDLVVASLLLLALTSPAHAVDGINSTPGTTLPIGAGGNGPFISVFPSGRIDFAAVPGNPSMRVAQNREIVFLTASGDRTMAIAADGGITFYLAKDSANAPIRFISPYKKNGQTVELGSITLTGPGPSGTGIFRFPNFESVTNNGWAGYFNGFSGGIVVGTKGGAAGTFNGATDENWTALEVTMPYKNGAGAYAANFSGDNGIRVSLHYSDSGMAGWFGGNVTITKNLTVGGIATSGVPVGTVTVGGAAIDNNTVLTANSLRDNVVDNCFTSSATGTGVVTKTAKNQFTCTTIIPGAGATGPQGPAGPPGPPGTIGDISCPAGQMLTGISKGEAVCGDVVLASYYQGIPEGWHSEAIDLPQDGVLNAHCYAAANISVAGTCPYDQWNTGVQAIIKVDEEVCSHDVSFNFPSCRVTFRSTASCMRPLAAGKHTISCYVGRYGEDTNAETFEWSSFGFNVIAK